MERARVGEIELCYQLDGEDGAPVMLLVSGLGGQLIGWDDGLVARLVDAGFRVVRFDNRDAGLSTSLDGAPGFDPEAARRQDPTAAAYTLDDMADDAAGLLDALGVEQAHVVGRSMGGMIAQTLAILHPHRVASLASIMSTTGDRSVGNPTPAAMEVLMRPRATDRQGYVAGELAAHRVLGSPAWPTADEQVAERAGRMYDRAFRPEGTARQLMAVMVSGDRTEALRRLSVPTVVIHGDADQLVTPSGGRATAAAIPGARLMIVPGMGHELPPGAWPQVVPAIVDNARAGSSR